MNRFFIYILLLLPLSTIAQNNNWVRDSIILEQPPTDNIAHFYEVAIDPETVYDGDTFYADIYQVNSIAHNEGMRLFPLSAPEVRGKGKKKGIFVRDVVRGMVVASDSLKVYVRLLPKYDKKGRLGYRRGKYGRLLSIIYLKPVGGTLMNLNLFLLRQSLAEYKDYYK